MPAGDVEVFQENERWRIRVEGEETLPRGYLKKIEAVAEARARAERLAVGLIVRDEDGTIGHRAGEGNDPREAPG